MITPSFGLTATERVLPRMALDFTTASLDSRVTFTRSGNTATVVNSSGLVAPINADLPRFDFDPIALNCKGLLIEEARTNLAPYSDDFSGSGWGLSGLSGFGSGSVVNAAISPDGTQNADLIAENASLSQHNLFRGYSGTTNTNPYTLSLFLKAHTRPALEIQLFEGATFSRSLRVTFNAQTGLITASSATSGATLLSSSITPFGNGWYRCVLSGTLGGTDTTMQSRFLINDGTTSFYTGDGTSGVYIYGAQLEAGAFPTSYIPTEATAVTRNADVATMTGTNFSDWFNASEGAFAFWTNVFADNSPTMLEASKAGSGYAELFAIGRDAGLDRWNTQGLTGGVLQSNLFTTDNTFVVNSNNKCAFAYKNASYATSANATTLATSTGSVPTGLDRLSIGHDLVGGGSFMSGYVQKIQYWPQRLTNSEVQAFSK